MIFVANAADIVREEILEILEILDAEKFEMWRHFRCGEV